MRKSFFRVLSGISGNLSAGWLGLMLIAPGFIALDFFALTKSLGLAIVSLLTAVVLDKLSQ